MNITLLIIDELGKIKEFIKNDFEFDNSIKFFKEIIAKDSMSKYYYLLKKMKNDETGINTEMNLLINNDEKNFYINLLKNNNKYYLFISDYGQNKDQMIENLLEINNMQTNTIRKLQKDKVNNKGILDDISKLNTKLSNTQRKLVKKNKIIEQNHKKFQLIIQNIGFGLILINQSGDIIISNSNFENTFGFIENILEFLEKENTEVYKGIKKSLKNLEPIKFNSIKLNNYINRYYEINLSFFDKKIEEYKYAIFTIKDITENRLNYLKVLKFKKAFYQSNDPVVITDINDKIKNVNKAFIDLYKFKKDELINKDINHFIKQVDLDEVSKKEIIYNKNKFGKVFPVDISVSTVKNDEESFSKIYIIVNINDYIKYQKKLKKLAHKDLMTETFNRQAGLRILKNTINKAYEENLTILFLDINGLKKVNDTLGHSKGDLLIKKVTKVVKDVIRESDVVVRFGGDEFLVILKNADLEIGKDIKKRINIELKNIDKYDFNIYVSIGVCEYKKDKYNTLTEFIEKADQKMYIEKEKFYDNKNKNIIKK